MQSAKAVFGIIGALVPVAYFGGLYWYFQSYSNSPLGMLTGGPGDPTMIGLGALGLLFCVPVALKILKLVSASQRVPGPKERAEAALETGEPAFDADAALARYMARKAAAGEEIPPSYTPPSPRGGPDAPRPVFGRKTN